MKNLNSVVGGTAAGRRFPADEARVAQAADIDAVVAVVPRAPTFAGQLRNSINAGGVHHAALGRHAFRTVRAKGSNRTRPKNPQAVRASQFQNMEQALHVEIPGPAGVLFATG